MIWDLVWLIVGLILVIKGGDWFVDSSIHIAEVLHIPRMVIGGTLVSLATTTPELVVSTTASYMGDSGIAIGNAVGSAIANIALIIGVVACMTPIRVDLKDFRWRATWMMGGCIGVIWFAWDLSMMRWQGFILLAASAVYLAADYWKHAQSKKKISKSASLPVETDSSKSLMTSVLLFILGAVLVIVGSRLLVSSGISLATILGIPSVVIGLTVIAVGTSLPELVTAITSARKKVADLSVGNIVGANVLNLTLITGASCVIRPLIITPFTRYYSFSWLILVTGLMIYFIGRKGHLERFHGILFLILYGFYTLGLILIPSFISV